MVKDLDYPAILLTRKSLNWATISNTISYIFNSSDCSFTDKVMPLNEKLREICDQRQCFLLYNIDKIII